MSPRNMSSDELLSSIEQFLRLLFRPGIQATACTAYNPYKICKNSFKRRTRSMMVDWLLTLQSFLIKHIQNIIYLDNLPHLFDIII